RQLVTLRRDVPVEFDLEASRFKGVKAAALLPIFTELHFERLAQQMGAEAGLGKPARPAAPPPPGRSGLQPRSTESPPAHAQLSLFDQASPDQQTSPKPGPEIEEKAEGRPSGRRYESIDDEIR